MYASKEKLILFNLKITAVRCSTCTRTLAIAKPSTLLQFAFAAHKERVTDRTAAELRVQRCLKQLEIFQQDFTQACDHVNEVAEGIQLIQAFVKVEKAHLMV